MARVKTEARREAFLAAALGVFRERGFGQASMDEIAARAGGSKATLYRYFDSKDALFMELVRRSASDQGSLMDLVHRGAGMPANAERMNEAVDANGLLDLDESVATTLMRFGQHILETFHTPQVLGILRVVIAAAVNPEIGKAFYEQGPARATKHLEQYFAQAMKSGKLRQADPHVAACHFYGLLESEVHQAGLFNVLTHLDNERIAAVAARAIDVFLRAYGCAPTE